MALPDLEGLIRRLFDDTTDNFGRLSVGEITEILDVAGEKDFTPERLRYYKDGSRRFLQYGTDANYSETDAGHLLEPDADQTLTLETTNRTPYPVGADIWPSMARRITQAPQAGDAVGGGFGVIDLANFDPSAISYSGTDADGYFWYHTADTGLSSVLLVVVRNGTILDTFETDLNTAASTLTIIEQRLNCYDVGPSVFRETFTDVADNRNRPQKNVTIGGVANDDGKGSAVFTHRVTMAVSQAAGNTGLGIEAGSIGVKASYDPAYKFKTKNHPMDLTTENSTPGTYEVVGAIRGDPTRPENILTVDAVDIKTTPGPDVTDTTVLIIAVDGSESNAVDGDFSTPEEHNPANSIVEIAEDNTLTGPDFEDVGTDIDGPVLAGTMTDPGGYQTGYKSVSTEGTGSKTSTTTGGEVGRREIPDTDLALVLADTSTAGSFTIDAITSQNS